MKCTFVEFRLGFPFEGVPGSQAFSTRDGVRSLVGLSPTYPVDGIQGNFRTETKRGAAPIVLPLMQKSTTHLFLFCIV